MEFEVYTDRLSETVAAMQTQLEEIEQTRQQIFSGLDSLGAMWDGSAHDVFQEQYHVDDQMLKRICSEIRQIVENVSTARLEYDKCEENVYDEIARIQI